VHGDGPPAKPAKEAATGSDEAISGAYHPNNPNPENLPFEGKPKTKGSKPAKKVTTGFGVEFSDMVGLRRAIRGFAADLRRQSLLVIGPWIADEFNLEA